MSKPTSKQNKVVYEKNAKWWSKTRQHSSPFERPHIQKVHDLIPEKSRVLDCGCGTGELIGRFFIEKDHELVGIDFSQPMIEIAKNTFPQSTWLVQSMETLSPQGLFNAVIAWDSFFHLTHAEQTAALGRFSASIVTGGILLINTGHLNSEAFGKVNGDSVYHASYSCDEYRNLLSANQFQVLNCFEENEESGGRTVWICQKE